MANGCREMNVKSKQAYPNMKGVVVVVAAAAAAAVVVVVKYALFYKMLNNSMTVTRIPYFTFDLMA
jgi:hypothetical protein